LAGLDPQLHAAFCHPPDGHGAPAGV